MDGRGIHVLSNVSIHAGNRPGSWKELSACQAYISHLKSSNNIELHMTRVLRQPSPRARNRYACLSLAVYVITHLKSSQMHKSLRQRLPQVNMRNQHDCAKYRCRNCSDEKFLQSRIFSSLISEVVLAGRCWLG